MIARDRERDLEGVEPELAGGAGAARVFLGREPHAKRADAHEGLVQSGIGGRSAGTLELDLPRVGSCVGERLHELEHVGMAKGLRPDVRGDDRNIDLRLLPSLRLRADRADDPPVELDMESGLIDERDDVARSDHSVRRMRPAHERLDTGELSRRYVYLRLVMN